MNELTRGNTLVILHGDRTGEEIMQATLKLLDNLPNAPQLEHYDLSLKNRKKTKNGVVEEAGVAMLTYGAGLKAPTDTADNLGSPNLILREIINADVILRTGRPLPGIQPLCNLNHPIHIVRMATGEAYGAKEWRQGVAGSDREVAQRTETITRESCQSVARFAFELAKKEGAFVYGGPKWTVSPVFEGMLKEEMDEAADLYPDVEYRPMLIDALYAGIVKGISWEKPVVIPSLNRDGDCLADMVFPMYGSIAGAASQIIGPKASMYEAAHGTAPDIEGKGIANPLALVLALGDSLERLNEIQLTHAKFVVDTNHLYPGKRIKQAALDAIAAGIKTGDLGGNATTAEFIQAVGERISG